MSDRECTRFALGSVDIDRLVSEAQALDSAGKYAEAALAWREVAAIADQALNDRALASRASWEAAGSAVRVGDHAAAVVDADTAHEKAVDSDDHHLIGMALELRGDLLRDSEDPDGLEHVLRRAADEYAVAGSQHDSARLRMQLGELFGANRCYRDALSEFRAAREVFAAVGAGLDAVWADDRIAAALIELGQLSEALDRLSAAARVADATDDRKRIAYAYYRLGWTLVLAERGGEALPHLQRAREQYQELGDLVGAASCDEKAASVLAVLREYDRAIPLYEQAVAVFDSFGVTDSARIAESNLADVFSTLRRYSEAVARRKAILERLGDRDDRVRAGVSVRLASDLVDLGDTPQALAILDSLQPYFAEVDGAERAEFRVTHARALNAAGRVSSARREAEELLRSVELHALPSVHARALEVVALCLRGTSGAKMAERYLAQAVALYLAIGDPDKAVELSKDLLPQPEAPAGAVAVSTLEYRVGYL